MTRAQCPVCHDPRRFAAEESYVLGTAPPFPLTKREVERHIEECLVGADVIRLASSVVDAISIVRRLARLEQRTLALADKAEQQGDLQGTIRAIDSTRSTVELLAKIGAAAGVSRAQERTDAPDIDNALRAAMAKRGILDGEPIPALPAAPDDASALVIDAEVLDDTSHRARIQGQPHTPDGKFARRTA